MKFTYRLTDSYADAVFVETGVRPPLSQSLSLDPETLSKSARKQLAAICQVMYARVTQVVSVGTPKRGVFRASWYMQPIDHQLCTAADVEHLLDQMYQVMTQHQIDTLYAQIDTITAEIERLHTQILTLRADRYVIEQQIKDLL
jgi:septal ring factor EnvC (AmiA/AmiB activator)